MVYLGDFYAGATVYFKWNSFGAGGESIVRSTDGTIYIYQDNVTDTETATGVTDTESFDARTGLNHVTVVTTNAFYAVGHDYFIVLTGAVIAGQTVNAVLAQFSIENRGEPKLSGTVTNADADTTTFEDSTKSATADYYNGCVVAFRSGDLKGLARKISDYAGHAGDHAFTVDPAFPAAPAQNDTFVIIGRID